MSPIEERMSEFGLTLSEDGRETTPAWPGRETCLVPGFQNTPCVHVRVIGTTPHIYYLT